MAKEKYNKKDIPEKTEKPGRPQSDRGSRVIIRVLGTDLDGEKQVKTAMMKVKGVSHSLANAICKAANVKPDRKLGSFTESEIEQLEDCIKNPAKLGIPSWLFNRRKDIETGEILHVSSTDVDVTKKFDVQRMVDKQTYKGVRHMLGLPVRGQRTKSSFRKGKTVGVVKKANRVQPKSQKK